jgi:hypothetical protein
MAHTTLDLAVTTTRGERFTSDETRELAGLVFKRFGRDLSSATQAWNRLLGNTCTKEQFAAMIPFEVLYPVR